MADEYRTDTLDLVTARCFSGAPDPSAGAGLAAPEGSIYLRNDGGGLGELYIKTGPADVDWTVAGGSAGGGHEISNAWAEPASPSALDEEFSDGTSLPSPWQRWTAANASWSPSATPIDPTAAFSTGSPRESINGRRPNWLMWQPPDDGTIYGYRRGFTLADGFYWMRVSTLYQDNVTSENGTIGIRMYQDAGGNLDTDDYLELELDVEDSNQLEVHTRTVVGGSSTSHDRPNIPNVRVPDVYLGIYFSRSTDRVQTYYSRDGIGWVQVGLEDYGANPHAYEWIFIYGKSTDAGYPGQIPFGVDFFRYAADGAPLG